MDGVGDLEERRPLLGEEERDGRGRAKRCSPEEAFDQALSRVPVGVFHLVLVGVCGWAIASDSVEIQCISFVSPQLDSNKSPSNLSGRYELRLNKTQEGVLDAIIFLGMMVGGYLWGSLSDLIGRRSCLLSSLTFNGAFGLASAFSPNYPLFLIFRFLSGVGVGGSFPVVFSYFSEFFSRASRGPFVIVLASFWTLGSIFAALLAWLVIGQFTDSAHFWAGAMEMEAWRIYVILCTFPSLSSALALLLLPESPSFLFAKGRLRKTSLVLRKMQLLNSCCRRSKEVWSEERWCEWLRGQLAHCHTEREVRRGNWAWLTKLFQSTLSLFHRGNLRPTLILLNVWFMFSFGYYGLLLWFPEYFKYIENCSYEESHNCTLSGGVGHSCSASAVHCNISSHSRAGDSIYVDSLYVALAGLPGTLLGIVTVNFIGARAMLAWSLMVSGLSSLLICVIPDQQKTEQVIVILSCTFSSVSIVGWNALDVLSTSPLFPVHLRSTAFGVQAMLGRVGAIVGNIAFGRLFGATPFLPIFLVAGVLIFAGFSSFILPNPRGDHTGCHRLRCLWNYCCRQCCSRFGKNINT